VLRYGTVRPVGRRRPTCFHCRQSRSFRVSAQQGQGDGKRITQNEFTDKAWQSIIAAPDIAKQVCSLPLCVYVYVCGLLQGLLITQSYRDTSLAHSRRHNTKIPAFYS